VSVTLQNIDNGVPHDVSFGRASGGPPATGLPLGTSCYGPCTDSYSFTAPGPGNYAFFCSLHPDMAGTFVVSP
jgi:plastocyanin